MMKTQNVQNMTYSVALRIFALAAIRIPNYPIPLHKLTSLCLKRYYSSWKTLQPSPGCVQNFEMIHLAFNYFAFHFGTRSGQVVKKNRASGGDLYVHCSQPLSTSNKKQCSRDACNRIMSLSRLLWQTRND